MTLPGKYAGFSLLEVVLATGIFAVAVTAILAVLPMLTRQSADSADALVAQRLPDGVRIELQRLAGGDLGSLAATVPIMAAPLDHGLDLVATRDGARLHSRTQKPPPANERILTGEQYFHIEVWRFKQAPLSYDASAAVLPLYVRVSWPYRIPGNPEPTELSRRSQLAFTVALNR